MPIFFCEVCNLEFVTGKPVKKEYKDYILGPCSRNVAFCAVCGSEASEKIIPRPLKAVKQPDYCDGNCRSCDMH